MHVGRDRVVPGRAGRELERQPAEGVDEGLEAFRLEGVDLAGAVGGVDAGAQLEAVGQARGVAQQVDDAHRRVDRPGDEGAGYARAVDGQVAPGRDPAVHGVVDRDPAFLDQHHEGDAGDRLGHRIDAKDRVLGEPLPALQRCVAEHALVHEVAFARHRQQRAGQESGADVALGEEAVDAREPFGAEAQGCGRGLRHAPILAARRVARRQAAGLRSRTGRRRRRRRPSAPALRPRPGRARRTARRCARSRRARSRRSSWRRPSGR